MFGDYLVWDSVSDQNAKAIFKVIDKKIFLRKVIISIGGISGTRKSETAFRLAEVLINNGKQSHIISGDDYYRIPWHVRNDERKRNIDMIGPNELDWLRLKYTFETFKNPLYNNIRFSLMSKFSTDIMECSISKDKCDVLIFEGLYACDPRIDADVKIHIGDVNPSSTFKFRQKRKKEDEDSNFRQEVVRRECNAINSLVKNSNIIVERGENGQIKAKKNHTFN